MQIRDALVTATRARRLKEGIECEGMIGCTKKKMEWSSVVK